MGAGQTQRIKEPLGSSHSEPAVSVRGLARSFGERLALCPLDLDIGYGAITGLIGPNGSGKTTFLRLLVGLLTPSAGTASVAGVRLVGEGVAIRRRVTYAPGEIGHYGELSLEDHLRFLLAGRAPAALARALTLAERLGLPAGARVRSFSHGMKRQMLFAAALAPDVRVRILDEPTEGLDPSKRGEILAILREDLEAAGGARAIVLSSHHLGEVDRACERLLFLERGRLLADERAADLARRARRLLRLRYGSDAPTERLATALERLGAERVRWEGSQAAVVLACDDPRPFLAGLVNLAELPAPLEIAYGRLSLAELYRDLYGVEGL